ncbi:hypothetical protein [Armatimonas sp.]|uniref:hypothetical protein n=1 Tax=Armatimonas sp. TaxID=1872638 RepID=UPI00286D1782|nr:hypothetical protein [Armatimonas sp.]
MTPTLPHHLVVLLCACRELNTTETKILARHVGLAPATVNAYFQRASQLLGTTDRFSTVQQAFRLGILLASDDNLLINGDFTEGHRGQALDASLPWSTVIGWSELRPSTPQWITEHEGEPAAMMMWGVADVGEAIFQSLPPVRQLQPGRSYRFSAEYRFGPVRCDWPTVPRQPMFVDFVVRVSVGALPHYTTPDTPGQVATLGRLHYAARPPVQVVPPAVPITSEYLEELRRFGGEHAVVQALYTDRVGGNHYWEWEWGAIPDWTADAPYNCLTIHPTNDLLVGKESTNPDAPLELAWGQIRRIRFIEIA